MSNLLSPLWGPDDDKKTLPPSGYLHWCPGCKETHLIPTARCHIEWDFNGNIERPTFKPSVKLGDPANADCHYNIEDGKITFHGDCKHDLKNSVVPMEPIPEDE